MIKELFKKEEKKVEYLELIYDLIFVYVIGRNNSLLHHVTGGFVDASIFWGYILCSLVVIQIWSFSTYYINMHGRNGLRDHLFLLTNMFLLYFIGEGTRVNGQDHQLQYHIAWALILINIGAQYLIERRNHKKEPLVYHQTGRMVVVLFGEALIVLGGLPLYYTTGISLVPAAIVFGIAATFIHGRNTKVLLVDFTHLSERIMLYVVFTFGEMIIALSSYFEDDFSIGSVYFALMSFLIVVGLFLSYGTVYDHLIDRARPTPGLLYMLLHIVLIFALNLITASLEFMHDSAVSLLPKMLMLILSFLLYYVFLFLTLRYSKSRCRPNVRFILMLAAMGVGFSALMLLFREMMYVNIALTAVFVFAIFLILYRFSRVNKQ